MRLSLMKGAHADLSSTTWQEIGVKRFFGLSVTVAPDVPLHICDTRLRDQNSTEGHTRFSEPRRDSSRTALAQLLNPVKGPTPASLIEEVNELMKSGLRLLREGDLVDTGFRGHDRPVNEERSPQYVLPRQEAPEATVHTIGAVIAHNKIIAGRYDHVRALHVSREARGPLRRNLRLGGGIH